MIPSSPAILIGREYTIPPLSIQFLSRYRLTDAIPFSELERLEVAGYIQDAFPLLSLDKEPHYLAASVIDCLVKTDPALRGQFAGDINVEDLKLSKLGGLSLDRTVVETRLDYLKTQGVIAVVNQQVPLADVDLILRDYLHAHFGQPLEYKTNVVALGSVSKLRAQSPAKSVQELEEERLILEYLPLVKKVAYGILARLPSSISIDDLIGEGNLGLLSAVRNYDPARVRSFEAYAKQKIRGAILDHLRNIDHLPKGGRRLVKQLERLGTEMNKEVTLETALEAGLTVKKYEKARELRAMGIETIELHANGDYFVDKKSNSAEQILHNHALSTQMWDAINELDNNLRVVLTLYYRNELNFKEIGRVLDLTESRISQLHRKAVEELKDLFSGEGLM